MATTDIKFGPCFTFDTSGAVDLGACERCQGNGEIVTDWGRYLSPQDGDAGDEATADCPDCGGRGELGKVTFPDLSPFMQGYVRAAFEELKAVTDEISFRKLTVPLRLPPRFSDLAPATLAAMMADCERALASKLYGAADGAFFWQERQEGNVEAHPHLSDFPPLTLTIRDDGLVYQEARS